jgi:feruloyl-CoA synthase
MTLSSILEEGSGVKARHVELGNPEITAWQVDGTWHVDAVTPLGPVPTRYTDRLVSGASKHADRTLVARRGSDGDWIRITYADMLERVRHIGQALLDRGLSAERPLVILSGNDLEHFQLALGAAHAGIPYVPLSPAYSLVATDYDKLRDLIDQVTPGAIYASDGRVFARAIDAVRQPDTELILGGGECPGHPSTSFASLLDTELRNIDEVNASVDADAIVKFLFTSGSTKKPKAVITTHRMLCSNQQMLLQTFPFFGKEPPVVLDWLPWNHCFGGSHNVGIVLYNGGTLYLDDGKPTAKDFGTTLRNLREIAPTVYFNIPKGFEMLTEALEQDPALRENFFSRVKLFYCAGAGLSQSAWSRLDAVATSHCGESIRIMTGLGMTETSPSCTFGTGDIVQAGYVGVPAPGCRVKLVPIDGKLEARFAGPNVMPGYWRAPHLSADAFDDDGYYRTGDALRLYDDARPELGFIFDGRIAEDFKLSSGTFVSVGPLRARVINQGAPYVMDAVVTGLNRDVIGLLIFPRLEHCQALSGLPVESTPEQVLGSSSVRAYFARLLAGLNAGASGSSNRIDRLLLLSEPPSIDHRELTDKGSINQAAVMSRRAAVIDAMYADEEPQTIVA